MHRAGPVLVLALVACARPSPPPPPGPPLALPPGCEQDLGGAWVLDGNATWRYQGTDDGGTLVLAVERRWPDGGTPPGPSSTEVVLRRTPKGFAGETRAPRGGPSGPLCDALIPVEVADCSDGGLKLRTVDRMRVDGRCAPVDAAPGERRTHLLLRPEAGASARMGATAARAPARSGDAGIPDAGTARPAPESDGG